MLKTFYKVIDMPVVPEIERVNLAKESQVTNTFDLQEVILHEAKRMLFS